MSGIGIGVLIGLALGLLSWLALKALAGRVELDDTKRVLGLTGVVDLILFPVVGGIAGWLMSGD